MLQRTPISLLPHFLENFSHLGAPNLFYREPGGIYVRSFAILMSSFFDLPMTSIGPNSVDLVALESLVSALALQTHGISNDRDETILTTENTGLVQFILHYFAGESLDKSYRRTPKSDRYTHFILMFSSMQFTLRYSAHVVSGHFQIQ